MSKSSIQINKMCLASMFLALGWLFPFITMQIPEFGNMLCPMHIPVLIAGFVLGPWYGLGLGLLTPLTRSLVFGTPVMYPTALCMAFELATYGFVAGFMYNIFKKFSKHESFNIYTSLIIAMILGRIVWGLSRTFCGLFGNNSFTLKMFMAGAFINAWPGIIIQIIFIPALIFLLSRAHLLDRFMETKPVYHETREQN